MNIVDTLVKRAGEASGEGHAGWSCAMLSAAARIEELHQCLQDLYDTQNGAPPLGEDQPEWDAAMRRAVVALGRHKGDG